MYYIPHKYAIPQIMTHAIPQNCPNLRLHGPGFRQSSFAYTFMLYSLKCKPNEIKRKSVSRTGFHSCVLSSIYIHSVMHSYQNTVFYRADTQNIRRCSMIQFVCSLRNLLNCTISKLFRGRDG